MKTISDRIFELLKEKGMSQKEFSLRTGIAESSISDWKKKRTNPWTIIGIAIAIILLIYWLLTATILEEDENVIPILDGTEQVIP